MNPLFHTDARKEIKRINEEILKDSDMKLVQRLQPDGSILYVMTRRKDDD